MTPFNAPALPYRLDRGEGISRNQVMTRPGMTTRLLIDGTGNLIAYDGQKPVWSTGTAGADRLVMQSDGNLVLYAGNKALWQSQTSGRGSYMILSPAGTFMIYPDASHPAIWVSSKTDRRTGIVKSPKKSSHLLPDPLKIVKQAGRAIKDVAHIKIKKAVKDVGRGVNQITGSALIQTAFPVYAVPANIVNGAVTGGSVGALKAAQSVLKNPVAKATYAAAGLIVPPLAPATAGVVAGMEATSRVLDALESKDPKAIAAAALSYASTAAQAANGIPGAVRAMDLLKKTQAARGIAGQILSGDAGATKAAADTKKLALSGDAKAQAAHHLLSSVLLRQASKSNAPAAPAVRAAARKETPSLVAEVHAALTSPHGVRIGDYSVLRTGRVLHKGKQIPHKPQHKSGKAYEAFAKAHHGHHV
jgi:hypothetical protein